VRLTEKNCLKKQIGLPDRYHAVWDPLWPPQTGVLAALPNTCIANCGQTASISDMVTIDNL